MWEHDTTLKKILKIAEKYDLYPRYPEKYDYINLCRFSSNGLVDAQYHKTVQNETVLVIGKADKKCPNPKILEEIQSFDRLSGDHGSNRPWLRAEGKTFGHLKPARGFILPKTLDAPEQWVEVEDLIKYAAERD